MDVNDDFSNNSSSEESCTPEELRNVARNVSLNLLPEKSKRKYEKKSSARCGQSAQWWEANPGERVMQTAQLYPQMSYLDSAEPLWCERMQDMSGYVLPDIISPPLDEQLQINFTTAQPEHDFHLQNSGNPSPEMFLLKDQTKVLGEDSIMFENSNYSELHTKMKEWLPKISTMEIKEFEETNMISNDERFPSQIDSENSQTFPQLSKEENISSVTDANQRHLSILDCEKSHIRNEDNLSSSYNDNKLTYDYLKDEMEVAEEVVVTTEVVEDSKSTMFLGSFFFDSDSPDHLLDPKEGDWTKEVMLPTETKEEIMSPLGELMETTFDLNSVFIIEDDLCSLDPEPQPCPEPQQSPARLHHPALRLNIEAASQLLCEGLPDTPEVLKPVLKPEAEFDLVNFLMSNGDSNNNCLPTTPVSSRPCLQSRGKSHLSIADLRESHKYGRGKPSRSPSPSPSPSCSSGRPARKSATKFKKLLEEGLLDSTLDSGSMSSGEEDNPPKCKRRRSISSKSGRNRLNSDSDLSSVSGSIGEDSAKYRERRDRNNLSSKRSRQKRKMQQELKKVELKDLEEKNRKLRCRADELAAMVERVHKAWKEYLEKIKKD